MKRLVFLTSVFVALTTSTAFGAVKYNDNYYDLDIKAVSGELMIKASDLFKAMNYSVSYDANTKSSLFSNGSSVINISTATGDVVINGEACSFNVKPTVINDGVYVPAELLKKINLTVDWDYNKAYPLLYSEDYINASQTREQKTPKAGVKNGWNTNRSKFYYDDEPITGLQYVDGKMYSFDSNGLLHTGVFRNQTGLYGYDEYGNAYDGFFTIENKKYYFDNGKAYTEPTLIGDKTYNFKSDGTLNIGWVNNNGAKYHYDEFGYPSEGVVEIDGAKYLFIEGKAQVGAVKYDNKNYLLNADGKMRVNEIVNGIYYNSDGEGVKASQDLSNLLKKADSVLKQTGSAPANIYNYVAEHIKYKFMRQESWTAMANRGFNTGRGACYDFAACADILLKRAGYETRVVRGTGHYETLHYWNQVKINGKWTNIDACNKYFDVSDDYLKGKNYTFDKYEYPKYY